jgi:hypothetical protein
MASQPLSHSMPIERSAFDAKPGKMCAFLAASGSCGRSRRQVWVDWIFSPFGRLTLMPVAAMRLLVDGLLMRRKLPVQPVSAMAEEFDGGGVQLM